MSHWQIAPAVATALFEQLVTGAPHHPMFVIGVGKRLRKKGRGRIRFNGIKVQPSYVGGTDANGTSAPGTRVSLLFNGEEVLYLDCPAPERGGSLTIDSRDGMEGSLSFGVQ